MGMMTALRGLDQRFVAAPVRVIAQVLAALGLAYAGIGAAYWLYTVSDDASTSSWFLALCALPWCALPLASVFRGRPARFVGLLVTLAALGQFVLFMNSWGLNVAYLPFAVFGCLLMALPRDRPAGG